MNDVMKKRLIGVAILVLIGVATPLLLTRCMDGGHQDNGQDSMRVYDVQPNGQAKQANGGDQHDRNRGQGERQPASGGDGSESADHEQPRPDAISPQSPSDFSTPPVHGHSNDSSVAAGASDAAEPSGGSAGQASQHNLSASHTERSSQQRASSRQKPAHDYGASSVGAQGSQASSGGHANHGGSSSGLEKSSINGWVVQVASFSHRDNAERMAKKLKSRFQASYTPGQVNGRTLYRVHVGPFDSKQAANSAADKLSAAGHKGLVRHLP